MMYVCSKCGEVFSNDEIVVEKSEVGEYWGQPCYEEFGFSPCCHCEFEKAIKCAICGEWHREQDLWNGICENCIHEYDKDFDTVYKWSKESEDEDKVYLNSLLASILTTSEIEEILVNYIKDFKKSYDCSKYIECDKEWFSAMIANSRGGEEV